MRRHAKASSAGPTSGRGATNLGSIRHALATRGTSSGIDGSVAPSHRNARFPLALPLAALALLALAPLAQAKFVVGGFGTDGFASGTGPSNTLGGQFVSISGSSSPRGVAVNSSGNGAPAGTSYVVDGKGNRVQRFGPKGAFDRAWGENASGRDERQIIKWSRTSAEPNIASLGTITLSFGAESTPSINVFTTPGGEIRLENVAGSFPQLEALPSIGAGNISITGNPQQGNTIRFVGALSGTDVPPIVVDNSGLTVLPDLTFSASTLENGAGGGFASFEICSVASLCREGSAAGTTANGGQLNDPQGVAVNQANGHVYVTEVGNRRVSEFDADGNFIRTWGWDVIAGGQPNDTGTGFEICTVASECKQGLSGANGGEFGESIGYPVTDPANNVWVPDPRNRRIQEFDSSGNFIAAYGYNVDALGGGGALEKCTSTAVGACQAATAGSGPGQFASGFSLGDIAFDSSGSLYAIDSGNNRVQKFDPTLLASISNFGSATFPAYTTTAPQHLTASQGGARLDFSLTNNVTGGGERQIVELDPADAGVKDTSLVGAGLGDVSALAADDPAAALYATTSSNTSPRAVLLLGETPPPPPAVLLDPVTVKADTTATFSAVVNPGAGFVHCKFQYSTDQLNWTDVAAPACDTFASGGGQAVSQSVTGLTPNTHYFVRLLVSRQLVSNSTATSFTETFDTDSVPPVVSDIGAVQVADTSARMVGSIDPRNSSTGYVFEYGPTPSLGSTTTPLAIGAGTTPITVSRLVGGLSKDTTYYYRLVATNAFGSTPSGQKTLHTRAVPFPPANPGNCPNEALRTEQGSTYLPDCRAFEMVSPTDKNQGGAGTDGQVNAGFSEDGQAVAFCTTNTFGDPPSQQSFVCAPYLSRRAAGGWKTVNPIPPYCVFSAENKAYAVGQLAPRSFDRVAFRFSEASSCPLSPFLPGAPLPSVNLYRGDLRTGPPGYDFLAASPTALVDETEDLIVDGGSADFSHVVFHAYENQTSDSPAQGHYYKLYDWEEEGHGACLTPGGCVSLVSVDPSGQPLETETKVSGKAIKASTPLPSAISEDGDRIYFNNTAGGETTAESCGEPDCHLYMREDDAQTFAVAASECTAECGVESSPDNLLWASPDGEKALFQSCAKLTNLSAAAKACTPGFGATTANNLKLYRWDRSAPPGHRLLDLSLDHEPADGSQAQVLDVLGASSNTDAGPNTDAAPGNTVYFVAGGQLVSGEPAPTNSSLKLYRWRWNDGNPVLDYLGPYLSTWDGGQNSFTDRIGDDPNVDRLHSPVTPDGKYLLIQTKLRYDPAADTDTDTDLYRWDEEDGWLCVSCQPPGVPSVGGVNSRTNALYGIVGPLLPEHNISDDGRRVFFSTPDALVPQDVNGETGCLFHEQIFNDRYYMCTDIYEWHDGTVSLLTSGTGSKPFHLIGATASGNDVFFATSQRMVGWDLDNQVDIYDVRVAGGYPEPPAQPAICEGAEQCHGQGTVAPAGAGAGTAVFEGPGNPAPKHAKARKHKKRHHKRAGARHNRAANHNRRAER